MWIVTQATVVFDKQKPQSVVCVNYVIRWVQNFSLFRDKLCRFFFAPNRFFIAFLSVKLHNILMRWSKNSCLYLRSVKSFHSFSTFIVSSVKIFRNFSTSKNLKRKFFSLVLHCSRAKSLLIVSRKDFIMQAKTFCWRVADLRQALFLRNLPFLLCKSIKVKSNPQRAYEKKSITQSARMLMSFKLFLKRFQSSTTFCYC